MKMYKINSSFLKNSYLIKNLKLCSIRLFDNSKFPWIILIPNRKNVTDITELKSNDQTLLMNEIIYCSKIMKKIFKTKKLNVERQVSYKPQRKLVAQVVSRVSERPWDGQS